MFQNNLAFPAGTLHPKEKWLPFHVYPQAFTAQACRSILEIGAKYKIEEGTVTAVAAGAANPMANELLAFRDCKIRWIPCEAATVDLFRTISTMVTAANDGIWQADITGIVERLQFTEYDRRGSNYNWHSDVGAGVGSLRKLSFSLQLSPPDAYEGGDLEFMCPVDADMKHMLRQQGTAVIFPSYLAHRVSPILGGKRVSLVGWIAGPPYR